MRTHLFLLALSPLILLNTVHAIRGSRDKGLAEPEAKTIHQDIEDKQLEGFDKLVEGERALFDEHVERELAREGNSTVQGVNYYSCRPSEVDVVRSVVKTVRQKSAKLRSCFDTNSTATNFKNLVKRWFGRSVRSPSLKATLRTKFYAIDDALHANFNVICNPSGCNSSIAGLAINLNDSNHTIVLCQGFFIVATDPQYPEEPLNTFAHEMSHFKNTANTFDHEYGQNFSQVIAASNPIEALDNADNYGYFVAFANSKTC
jgi:hypothetical protein